MTQTRLVVPRRVIKDAGQIKMERYLEAFDRASTSEAAREAQDAAYLHVAEWAYREGLRRKYPLWYFLALGATTTAISVLAYGALTHV